jgi:amidohydrolase
LRIVIKGRQTHGAMPWAGVDPIVIGAQIVLGLQAITSREVNVTREPVVLTIGAFNGGNRANIIPDRAELLGTLRTYDAASRQLVMRRVRETAQGIARAGGGDAEVIWEEDGYIPLVNDAALSARLAPTLRRVAGADKVLEASRTTASEDFSFFAQKVPGFYFTVGVTSPAIPRSAAPANHSPRFLIDEEGLPLALRALLHVTVDFMSGAAN